MPYGQVRRPERDRPSDTKAALPNLQRRYRVLAWALAALFVVGFTGIVRRT